MSKYNIKHKIEGYTGKEACIFFNNGTGETENSWIAGWFERKGYEVGVVEIVDYSKMKVEELKTIAEEKGIEGFEDMKKSELIESIEKLG